MSYRFSFLVALLCSAALVNAQATFSHAVGASFYYSASNAAPGVTYSPRVNLELDRDLTLSVGTHATLGFSGTFNSQTGSSGSILFDIPVVVAINWGEGASPDSWEDFGIHAGVGLGYNYMTRSSNDVFGFGVSATSSAIGPLAVAGARFRLIDIPFSTRVSYMVNVKGDFGTGNVFGLGVSTTLGTR